MQSGCDDTGRAVLEVAHRQLQQVVPNGSPKYRINAVTSVQHEVLPYPGEQAGEDGEDRHRDANRDQGTLGAVNNDFVDDGLREERSGQCHKLQRERGEQHVAPNVAVLEQFRHKPAKTEVARSARRCVGVGQRFGLGGCKPGVARADGREFGTAERLRCVGEGRKEHDFAIGSGGDEANARLGRIGCALGTGARLIFGLSHGVQPDEQRKHHALNACRLEANVLDPERDRTARRNQGGVGRWRGEFTLHQLGRKRQTMQRTDRTQGPK